ncbi:MAG: hypothetical protein ACRERX_14425, partial [Pseudomonas sp.]
MRIAAAFAFTFVIGAITIFAAVYFLGRALGSTLLPLRWRLGIAVAGLLPLALLDLRAIARSTYCPIGWRRQTPRVLLRRYRITVAASLWGFDTGLVITTFRVAAISWGALLVAALGVSTPWAGVGYGLGFTIPFLFLLFRPRLGRSARQETFEDPGLEALLKKRSGMQGLSAALLCTSAG